MKSTIYLIFVMILIFTSSCSDETEDQLEFFENSFPGKWEMVKYKMPAWGQSIYYNGKLILNKDTTLTNLGIIEIPDFTYNQLLLNDNAYLPVNFRMLTPQNEALLEINYIVPGQMVHLLHSEIIMQAITIWKNSYVRPAYLIET